MISSGLDQNNFKLLLTDAAPYCTKTGTILKALNPTLNHVTCLAHALHNLAETIRGKCPIINGLIANLKKFFDKSDKNKTDFAAQTKINICNFPVVTRWGTVLTFIEFLETNFISIREYFYSLENSQRVLKILTDLTCNDLIEEINFVRNYYFLPNLIKRLESPTLKVGEVLEIIKSCKEQVVHAEISKRLDEILKRNPDLDYFIDSKNMTLKPFEDIFTFAPMTTVEAERSFSGMQYIMTSKKSKMSIKLLRASMFLWNTPFETMMNK